MARGGRIKGKMREQNGISVLRPDFGRGRKCFLREPMKFSGLFRSFTKFEWFLWLGSLVTVVCAYAFSSDGELLSLVASLVGVTALIFVAKGKVLGQVLCVVFSVFYGIVSFFRATTGR